MRFAPLSPIGAFVGLLCCALSWTPLAAQSAPVTQDARLFKLLKLEGHQVRWSLPADGAGRVLTYRVVTEPLAFPTARNCRGLTPLDGLAVASGLPPTALGEEAKAAFAMWEAVANVVFKEAPEGTKADILIGAQAEPEGWAFADVFYDAASPQAIKPISQALICLNPGKRWKVGFDGDLKTYDLRYTLAHEIGHAIGLDHPAGSSQIMHFRYEERFRALQPGDVRGAVALYGAPPQPGVVVAGGEQPGNAAAALSTPAGGRALGK